MPAVDRIFPRSVSLITKRRTIRSVERLSGDALNEQRTMNFNFRALLQLDVSPHQPHPFFLPSPPPQSNNKRRKRLGVVSPLAIYRNSLRAKLVGVKKGRFPRRDRFFLVKRFSRFTRDHLSEGNEFKRTGSW